MNAKPLYQYQRNTFRRGMSSADKKRGRACVTVGCFDLLHEGHLNLLRAMRARCSYVAVGVHDNESIMKNKGVRVVQSLDTRVDALSATKIVDHVFKVREVDPSGELTKLIERLRLMSYDVEYVRGDDWQDFPGNARLTLLGVPIHFHPYTRGISSTMLRQRLELQQQRARGGIHMDSCAACIEDLHLRFVYAPTNRALTFVLRRTVDPHARRSVLTPNLVTLLSLAVIIPALWLVNSGGLAYVVCIACHDMLDRLDGALARYNKVNSTTQFGAYLDAMCDKLFSSTLHLYLVYNLLHGMRTQWDEGTYSVCHVHDFLTCIVFVARVCIHIISGAVRTYQYMLCDPPPDTVIKASGAGKLATFVDNVSLMVYGSRLLDGHARFATLLMLHSTSAVFAIRSLMQKLI